MRGTAAIVNPKAGGNAARQWPGLAAQLGEVETVYTERPDHAREIAGEMLRAGFPRILAVGGDGTISETVNGWFQPGNAGVPVNRAAELGVIPFGTGGDFRRTLGLRDAQHAIDVVKEGKTLAIDGASIHLTGHNGRPVDRYFVNLTSFGMGGEVATKAKNFLSPWSGKAAFFYATLDVFLRYKAKTVELSLDGGEWTTHKILNIAIGNGRYHGGGMHVCPRGVLDSGKLEVTVIDALGPVTLAKDIHYLYSEDVYRHPKAHHTRATLVQARSNERVSIEVDGEPLGVLPLEARVLPGVIRILVP
jgi:YegS/Rv2252/BmrU family lipid kinase